MTGDDDGKDALHAGRGGRGGRAPRSRVVLAAAGAWRRSPTRVAVVLASAAVLACAWAALVATRPEPPPFAAVRAAYQPSDVALLDRGGAVVHVLRTDAHRRRLEWVPLDAVSPSLVHAVVLAEDRRFGAHGGVDARALAGAAIARLRGAPARGASTIAMQLAALVDASLAARGGRRTLAQKWRQMRLARALVRRWSRDEILEAYLNLVAFRGEVSGVGAAAWLLAGKAPHGLTDAEAVALAALVRAPNAPSDVVAARARRLAAASHADTGAERDGTSTAATDASPALIDAAARAVTSGDIGRRRSAVGLAPHLARRLLAGATHAVRSTLDRDLQRFAADALRRALADLDGRRVGDGAVLVADNESGDVLAYVAASGPSSRARLVDTVRARRQPGSTMKPFLYGVALARRLLTPASLLSDTPLEVAVAGGLYRPRDYDEQFRGTVTLRTALAASLNVPAVRTLGLVGGDAFVDRLRAFGFDGIDESGDWYGPSLALGAAEVSLWELVGAYRALANGGVWSPLHVTPDDDLARAHAPGAADDETTASPAPQRDGFARRAFDAGAAPRRVLDEAAAFLVGDVLSDREARSTTFGLESSLATPFWTAVKTGTSKDMRDNWCVGWSRRFTVGVWVGNASGEPMHEVSGVAGAAPVWLEVMTRLQRATPSTPPEPPPGVVAAALRFDGDVEPPRREWFLAGTEPPGGVVAPAAASARIVAPAAGTIVAVDPDIPPARQRVALQASGAARDARWRVDDADAGAAADVTLWPPTRGAHVVRLVDTTGRTLDSATIEVRGRDRR